MAAGFVLGACAPDEVPTPAPPSPISSAPSETVVEPEATSLRFGLGEDPDSIDPRFADDEAGLLVVDALFDSLTRHNADLLPVPSAARTWRVSDDQLTWTFTLDPQGTWHDGSLVSATDFVRSFQRIADGTVQPMSFQAHLLADVEGWEAAQVDGTPLSGVRATESGELEIRLQRPNADLPDLLAHPALAPIPAVAETDPQWSQSPIGNGPFRMVEPWAHNQFIRLAPADPDVQLDEVVFRIYAGDPTNTQQYIDFQAGQLQVAQIPPAEVENAIRRFGSAGDGQDGPGVLDGPSAVTYHYGFDTTRAPFDRPEMRQAVSLLIEREAIASVVMQGTRQAAQTFLPAGVLGAPASTCPWCRYDPDAARALLAAPEPSEDEQQQAPPEAASADAGPIVLLHNTGTTHAEIARRIAVAMREELGLEVEVVEQDLRDHVRSIRAHEGHLFRLGWASDHPMPSSFLVPLFHTRSLGRDNVTGFTDPEFDAMLDQMAATPGRDDRRRLGEQVAARLAELAPISPVLTYQLNRVVAANVRGFRMDPMGRVDLSVVRLVDPS